MSVLSLIDLPEDILIQILSYFKTYPLIKLELVSKYIQTIIRNTKWNGTLQIFNPKKFSTVSDTYHFSNLECPNLILRDNKIERLYKYQSLTLKNFVNKSSNIVKTNFFINCRHLNSLDLSDSTVITDVGNLTNLESLVLDNISMNSIVLANIENLTNVTRLSIANGGSKISDIEKLSSMTNIKSLNIDKVSVGCRVLQSLHFVENLELSSCHAIFNFNILTRLKKLKLNFSNTTIYPNCFCDLTNLTHLHLFYGQISTESFKYFTRLKSLKLESTSMLGKVDEDILNLIVPLTNLSNLELIQFSSDINSDINKMTNLKSLNLKNCRVSTFTLEGLTNLRKLNFEISKGKCVINMDVLQNLDFLGLRIKKFNKMDDNQIIKMTNLTHLHLESPIFVFSSMLSTSKIKIIDTLKERGVKVTKN